MNFALFCLIAIISLINLEKAEINNRLNFVFKFGITHKELSAVWLYSTFLENGQKMGNNYLLLQT